ncbi:unnamed protein product [Trichobilharzia regenti]|nr:unnamed protein product [Trichobilharzia regenti]
MTLCGDNFFYLCEELNILAFLPHVFSLFSDLRSSDDLQRLRQSRLEELSTLFFQYWNKELREHVNRFNVNNKSSDINESVTLDKNTCNTRKSICKDDTISESSNNPENKDETLTDVNYMNRNRSSRSGSQQSIVYKVF